MSQRHRDQTPESRALEKQIGEEWARRMGYRWQETPMNYWCDGIIRAQLGAALGAADVKTTRMDEQFFKDRRGTNRDGWIVQYRKLQQFKERVIRNKGVGYMIFYTADRRMFHVDAEVMIRDLDMFKRVPEKFVKNNNGTELLRVPAFYVPYDYFTPTMETEMGDLNKVQLIGRLGRDPETHYTASGAAITNVAIATSERWRDKQSGEQREKTEWHRVVFFSRQAEVASEYLRKGSLVYIEGKLQTRKWQGEDGNDRYTTEIVVSRFDMLGGRPEGAQESAPAGGGFRGKPEEPQQGDAFSEDDIPF